MRCFKALLWCTNGVQSSLKGAGSLQVLLHAAGPLGSHAWCCACRLLERGLHVHVASVGNRRPKKMHVTDLMAHLLGHLYTTALLWPRRQTNR